MYHQCLPFLPFSPLIPSIPTCTRKWWWHGYLVSLCKVQLHLGFGRGYTINLKDKHFESHLITHLLNLHRNLCREIFFPMIAATVSLNSKHRHDTSRVCNFIVNIMEKQTLLPGRVEQGCVKHGRLTHPLKN